MLDERLCPTCQQAFVPKRRDRKYCSVPCAEVGVSKTLRAPSVMPRSPTKAAYFAGIIDGEGHIGLRFHTETKDHPAMRKYAYIKVCMTCNKTIQALADYFGGKCGFVKPQMQNRKDQWRWTATTAAARTVLLEIRPYLITKADLVDEILAYHGSERQPTGVYAHRGNHERR